MPEQHVFVLLDDGEFTSAVMGWLEKRGVLARAFANVDNLMAAAALQVPALVLAEDEGGGPPASIIEARLSVHLDERLHDVPMVVAQTARARRPLPGEVAYNARSNARFVRLPTAARSVANTVCTVLAQRPHVVVRPAGPAQRSRGETREPRREKNIRSASAQEGVLRAVHTTLSTATSTLAAQVERVADRFEIRSTESDTFRLQVGWLTPRAERFVLRADGLLQATTRDDVLSLVPQRGIKHALMSMFGQELEIGDKELDAALLIRAGDGGRAFLHATKNALLTVAPFLVEVRREAMAFRVVLNEVPRHALEAQVNATFDLWLRAQNERLGVALE